MTAHSSINPSWAEMPVFDRLHHLGRAVVETSATDAVLAMLRRAMLLANTGHQGGAHILTGATNTGKTTATRLFLHDVASELGGTLELGLANPDGHKSPVASVEYIALDTGGETIEHPVVRIEIGKHPTFNSLMNDVLYALLRQKPPPFHNYPEMMTMLYNQLYLQKIKLLIFDDVQHVANSRNGTDAAEVFKVLAKVTNAEVVLCGLSEGTRKIAGLDNQLKFLRLEELAIAPLAYPYSKKGEFIDFLSQLEAAMPFAKRSPLSDLDLAQRLHSSSQGIIGALKSILRVATLYAIEEGHSHVDRKVLGDALRDRLGRTTEANNAFLGANPPPPPPGDQP